MTGRTLEDLLVDYQAAEPEAFDHLYVKLCPVLYRIAFAHLRNDHDAQDAVQATFLKIHRFVLSYDPAQPAMAWIFTVARSAIADVARQRGRATWLPGILPDPGYVAPQQLRVEIAEMLSSLAPGDRALLASRVLEDLSFDELADRMRVPAATLRKRFSRLVYRLNPLK